MIRIIDDAGNHLAFPIDMENPEVASMIMDSMKIDIIMRELREKSVEDVVSRLLELKVTDHTDILRIVSKLFDEAAISLECQNKFGELTKKLIHVLPSLLSRNKIDSPRFKPRELIAIKIEKEFWRIVKNKKPTMHFDIDKDRGMTMFLAHLYNIDMFPDDRFCLMLVMLSSRQKRHKYIKLLLKQIKPKILQKISTNSVRDQGAVQIHKFMKENKIVKEKSEAEGGDVDESDSDSSKSDDDSSASDNENASDSEKPSTSKAIKNTPSSENDSKKDSKKESKSSKSTLTDEPADIVKLFEDHLANIQAKRKSSFDIQLFKTCNDDEKRQCSKKLLHAALKDSKNPPKVYAELVLSILQLSIPTKISKKNFNAFLKEAFEEEMKILSKQIQDDNVDFKLLKGTGEFLAELYVVDGLKIIVFNNWLEQAKSLSIGSETALKILLDVFKIFQSSMKKRDDNAYKNFVGFLKDFRDKNQIPEDFLEWFDKILSENEAQVASSENNKSTSSTEVVNKTPAQPISSPYHTCKKFQEFLTALKSDELTSYQNYKITDTSTEALQSCASIFLENCIVEPGISDVFCKNLSTAILPALSSENQAKFKKYLKYYVYTEMAITANLENYEASNWDRSGKLTCCMCELYKIYIFEMDLMDAWIERLHVSTKTHYSESNREFQAALLLSGTVMGRREPNQGSTKKVTKRMIGSSDDLEKEEQDECKVVAVARNLKMKKSKYMGIMVIDTDATFKTAEMKKFSDIVLNIQKYTMDDVSKAFHKIEIENDKDFEKFLKTFFDLCIKCPYPTASASITEFLCLELKPFEFREKISKLICDDLREKIAGYTDQWDDFENDVDNVVLVAAEFYNYGILTCQSYMSSLEKLATNMKSTKPIFIFHLSLFTTALRIIHTGDGSDLQHVYRYFKAKPRSTMTHELVRRYRQFVDHFSIVFELSAAVVKNSQKKVTFEFILDNLNENNFDNSIKFVEKLDVFKNKSSSAYFIKKVLSDMKNLDLYVRFGNEIAKFKYDFKEFVQGSLVVEFGNALDVSKGMSGSAVMKPLKESDIPRVQTILDFLIALYRTKFCNSGYLDLFLQFLSQEVCENRLKCAGYFLKILGARIERERLSMLEESFSRINHNLKSEKCKILFDRIEKLSNNKWKFECDEDERSYMLAMGADWKNKEEKVEVQEKNKKTVSKSGRGGKKKVEKEELKKSEKEMTGITVTNAVGDNMEQGESSSNSLNQNGKLSSNSDQKGSLSTKLDQGGSKFANLDQGGAKPSNLDQNQSITSNSDSSNPISIQSSKSQPEITPIQPQINQQDTKPLTPTQIKLNYDFFTKTESDFEIFLKNLQNSSTNLIKNCQKLSQKVTRSNDSQNEFLQNIWKYCLIDGNNLVTEVAEMFKSLTEKEENFTRNLEIFIKSRINSLLAIAKSANVEEHEGVRQRMANAILFIAALYSQDLISDNLFQSCAGAKLTSLLNCKEVADMLVILAKKINEDCEKNIQLQAKVLGLENLQETKFSEIFGNIKDDLMLIRGN